jgi:hypothetical protein
MIRRFFSSSSGGEHDDTEGGGGTNRKKVFFRASLALLGALAAAAVFVLVVLALPEDEGTAEAEDQKTTAAEDQKTPSGAEDQEEPSEAAAQGNPFRVVMQDSPSGDKGASVTAKCPEGYVPTGGGFDVHQEWVVRDNYPAINTDRKGEGWTVYASPDKNAKPFTAYAVCAPESLVRGIWYVSTKATLGSKSPQNLAPVCNGGQAVGGGYKSTWSGGWGGSQLIRSQPNYGDQLRSWLVTARNTSSPMVEKEVEAYAVCVPNGVLHRLDYKSNNQRGSGSTVINVGSPHCPSGSYLLGGGTGVANDQADNINWSHNRPGGGNQPTDWAVGVESWGWGGNHDVYSIAMCGTFPGESDSEKSGKMKS